MIALTINNMGRGFEDAALVLVAHGSSSDPRAGEAAFQRAVSMRQRGIFAEVVAAFWKQEPRVSDAVAALPHARIYIVPLLACDGYFADRQIPQALGFRSETGGEYPRQIEQGGRAICYCRPVGTHPWIERILADLARETVASRPFPRAPIPSETALIVAGHGTGKHSQSRLAVESHVQALRAQGEFGEVHAVFLEEAPRIEDCHQMTALKSLVVVPLFIGEGPHVLEDLPVCLGEARERVRIRLAASQSGWPNPGEKHGKRIWLTASVGGHPAISEVILARVLELAPGGLDAK